MTTTTVALNGHTTGLNGLVLRQLSSFGHVTAELDISEDQLGLSSAPGPRYIGPAQLSVSNWISIEYRSWLGTGSEPTQNRLNPKLWFILLLIYSYCKYTFYRLLLVSEGRRAKHMAYTSSFFPGPGFKLWNVMCITCAWYCWMSIRETTKDSCEESRTSWKLEHELHEKKPCGLQVVTWHRLVKSQQASYNIKVISCDHLH